MLDAVGCFCISFFWVLMGKKTLFCQKDFHIVLYESNENKFLLRPYQEESTTSRLISEVKPVRAWLVLGLETTWEHQVS